MSDITGLPLFPLRLVVFPETTVNLRIFEPRYVDMMRDPAVHERGFGICLTLHESDATPPQVATIGTRVMLTDFFNTPDNLLGITVQGQERFRVEQTRVRDNGLMLGDVMLLPEPPNVPVQPEHALLATLFERIIEQHGGPYEHATPAQIQDSVWLSYRLCELLPIRDEDRQRILACDDAYIRLDLLLELIGHLQNEDD